ncbi:uncharacterized protein LOC134821431 [Bolinopsis microptera]|uniref:uncharacterized protein LOC134821431 n=1 Tax=Bolinopsis microptera TaxID=2820187 RepID=UPI00307A5349
MATVRQGWLPVEREVKIEWDPESTPLEIKTNSVLGSNDQVYVFFYSAEGLLSGGVVFRFGSTSQYWLHYCSSTFTNFPVKPPSTADKVWRITLTRTTGVRVVIHCNEVEVFNKLLSQSTCPTPYWSTYWSDDVAKIQFHSSDTASDYYIPQGPQPGWLPVERGVEIEWDSESTPLEIKTNSVLGSNDQVYVFFYSAEGQLSGGVVLRFGFTPQYWLPYCSSTFTNFPVKPPSTADKVWRITLTRTAGVRLVIHCNEVGVFNKLISQSTCPIPYWSTYWTGYVTKIQFHSSDTASDYYGSQPVSCTGLNAEWRTAIRTTTQFPVVPGTVVEVNCIESKALNKGSSEVTCTSGTEFIFDLNEPECINTVDGL